MCYILRRFPKIGRKVIEYSYVSGQCRQTIQHLPFQLHALILIDFLLTVKAATLLFIPGRGSAISFAKQGKLGSIFKQNLGINLFRKLLNTYNLFLWPCSLAVPVLARWVYAFCGSLSRNS